MTNEKLKCRAMIGSRNRWAYLWLDLFTDTEAVFLFPGNARFYIGHFAKVMAARA